MVETVCNRKYGRERKEGTEMIEVYGTRLRLLQFSDPHDFPPSFLQQVTQCKQKKTGNCFAIRSTTGKERTGLERVQIEARRLKPLQFVGPHAFLLSQQVTASKQQEMLDSGLGSGKELVLLPSFFELLKHLKNSVRFFVRV